MNKKNLSLIIAIAIQAMMILSLIGSIYIPKIFIKPHEKFLYISMDDYNQSRRYQVKEGKLIKEINERKLEFYASRLPYGKLALYIYDISTNKATEISIEEAEKLTLDPNKQSPDGFEITCFKREEGIFTLFLGPMNDCKNRYLIGHGISKKLNLSLNLLPAYYNFRFIGWIVS